MFGFCCKVAKQNVNEKWKNDQLTRSKRVELRTNLAIVSQKEIQAEAKPMLYQDNCVWLCWSGKKKKEQNKMKLSADCFEWDG